MTTLVSMVAWAFVGALMGAVYFTSVRWSARFFVAGQTGAAIMSTLVRLLAAAGVFVLLAQLGALPLLFAFGGFLAARTVLVRRTR